MDYAEKYGKSVEEAIALALADLKVSIDDVNVTLLEEPSRGFLGFGGKLARVRVEKKAKEEPKEEPKKEPKKEPVKEVYAKRIPQSQPQQTASAAGKPARRDRPRRDRRDDRREGKKEFTPREPREAREPMDIPDIRITEDRPTDLAPITEHAAIAFLKEMTDKMGLAVEISAMANEENIYLDIEGKDSGTVIGKRGQTLDAVQYLTSLVVNKDKEKYVRVVVDAENYRAKREQTLQALAVRLADKVIRTKKSVRLEPMNPYERKVIHATLQPNPKISTRSEGEEPYRRVIIELK